MPPNPAPRPDEKKKLKLALQGGGSHGAYAWGVIDALLEDGRLEVEAVVGTSAGAMNATVTAAGLVAGGVERARAALAQFWRAASDLGKLSPMRPTAFDKQMSRGNMDYSPLWSMYDAMSRMFSPYEMNPQNMNPLLDLLKEVVDFDALRGDQHPIKLFVTATNVLSGRLRVFDKAEITPEAVMASACLPLLFQAVQIDNEYYWDGGYSGNPPIYPLIYAGGTSDILIVQISPVNIPDVPRTTRAIIDRINTLSFNSSLMREMRAIQFVTELVESGELDADKYPRVNIHTIDAEAELAQFSVSSQLNSDWDFLQYLFDLGRRKAKRFLSVHFDQIGNSSTTHIREKFL